MFHLGKVLDAKGSAAPTGFLGIGIVKNETLAVETVGKFQLRSYQVDVALLVDHHLDPVLLDNLVALQLFVGDL